MRFAAKTATVLYNHCIHNPFMSYDLHRTSLQQQPGVLSATSRERQVVPYLREAELKHPGLIRGLVGPVGFSRRVWWEGLVGSSSGRV